MNVVIFPVYFECVGYQELELPDTVDVNDEFEVKCYISDHWDDVPLPDDYEYVGDCQFDWNAHIEIIKGE